MMGGLSARVSAHTHPPPARPTGQGIPLPPCLPLSSFSKSWMDIGNWSASPVSFLNIGLEFSEAEVGVVEGEQAGLIDWNISVQRLD